MAHSSGREQQRVRHSSDVPLRRNDPRLLAAQQARATLERREASERADDDGWPSRHVNRRRVGTA